MSQTIRAALKFRGKYTGCDPRGLDGQQGDDRFPVYADRDQAQGWETAELTRDGTKYFVRYLDANRQLTVTDDGRLATRAPDTNQGWETLSATQQPDGPKFLYRMTPVGPVVLEIEVLA